MLAAEQRSRAFQEGQRFHHELHGAGVVKSVDHGKEIVTMKFDNGEASITPATKRAATRL